MRLYQIFIWFTAFAVELFLLFFRCSIQFFFLFILFCLFAVVEIRTSTDARQLELFKWISWIFLFQIQELQMNELKCIKLPGRLKNGRNGSEKNKVKTLLFHLVFHNFISKLSLYQRPHVKDNQVNEVMYFHLLKKMASILCCHRHFGENSISTIQLNVGLFFLSSSINHLGKSKVWNQ